MGVTQALRSGRHMAERLMVDTCRVTRVTGSATDPLTGTVVDVVTQLYSGRAKAQTYEGYETNPDGGGHQFTQQRYSVHFPVGAFEPKPGDVVEWTSSVNDPDLVGAKDRITGLFNKSFATAMRVFVDREVA